MQKQDSQNLSEILPSAGQIYAIIFLPILFFVVTLFIITNDIRQTGYWHKLYRVTNSVNLYVDTVSVIHQQQIAAPIVEDQVEFGKDIIFKKLLFHYNPEFMSWVVVISIMMAFAAGVFPLLIMTIFQIYKVFNFNFRSLAELILLTLIIGLIISLNGSSNPYYLSAIEVIEKFEILLNETWKLKLIIIFTLIISTIPVFGQLLVNKSINRLPIIININDGLSLKEIKFQFLLLRNNLKYFLIINSILIVFSIITSELIRKSINAEIQVSLDVFPKTFVYMYGLVFSFFLAIIYLPIYFRLQLKGRLIKNSVPQNENTQNEFSIAEVFSVRESPIETVKIILSILAPVLTSLVPGLFNS